MFNVCFIPSDCQIVRFPALDSPLLTSAIQEGECLLANRVLSLLPPALPAALLLSTALLSSMEKFINLKFDGY
jgi:hypothetical protein